ncbi:MAG: hypothetical protein KIT00_04235 [Rhodospirillales bacterium]|nr:hypothetical protein [Rhodospirillales bacterium]
MGCTFDSDALWPAEPDPNVEATSKETAIISARPQGEPARQDGERRPLVQPLMVIEPDADRESYETSLYMVVGKTLDRQPNAVFDLVAVSPATARSRKSTAPSPSRKRAEAVRDSLVAMGLPPTRIVMAEEALPAPAANEVRIYTRY